ncbi:MAG: polyhydroxyalkanoate synthesis repressor PhaR [Pseudomonadota bacterium]
MPSQPDTSTLRTLKKYPNRRLYDTHESAYITLDGVRKMVCEQQAFRVIDSRTGEDITRSVLLQIVCEHESAATSPCFNLTFLEQLIRCSDDTMSVMVGEFLERSLGAYTRNQDALRQQMNSVMNIDPVELMSNTDGAAPGTWHDSSQHSGQQEGRIPT